MLALDRLDATQSVADLYHAIFLNPNEPSYYFHKAEAYLACADMDSCLAYLRECYSLSQSKFIKLRIQTILYTQGLVLLDQKRYERAHKVYMDLLEWKPKSILPVHLQLYFYIKYQYFNVYRTLTI